MKNYKFFKDEMIIDITYKAIKNILDYLKSFIINSNYGLVIKDCVMMAINNLNELISKSSGTLF